MITWILHKELVLLLIVRVPIPRNSLFVCSVFSENGIQGHWLHPLCQFVLIAFRIIILFLLYIGSHCRYMHESNGGKIRGSIIFHVSCEIGELKEESLLLWLPTWLSIDLPLMIILRTSAETVSRNKGKNLGF